MASTCVFELGSVHFFCLLPLAEASSAWGRTCFGRPPGFFGGFWFVWKWLKWRKMKKHLWVCMSSHVFASLQKKSIEQPESSWASCDWNDATRRFGFLPKNIEDLEREVAKNKCPASNLWGVCKHWKKPWGVEGTYIVACTSLPHFWVFLGFWILELIFALNDQV